MTNDAATLCLEGRLVGPWVAELRQCCEGFLGNGRQLILDLAELSFADRDGAGVLRNLVGRQATLINCPLFLIEQLKQSDQ